MKRTVLPTHLQRRAIIDAPMPRVNIVASGRTWGGTFIRDSVPTEGRRVWRAPPEDEEWMRNKYHED
jgi:hypothetical protein